MRLLAWAVLCFLLPGSREEEDDCQTFARLAYSKPGNITLTGIFDVNAGENCTAAVEFGVEEMAAAVWTVTALERHNYLPGIRIGLSLFDACSGTKTAQEAFAEAVLRESCQNAVSAGTIAGPEVESRLTALSHKLSRTITRLEHILTVDGLLTIVAELLTNLHWTTVNRVVGDTRDVLDGFSLKMSDEGICVYDQVLSSDEYAVNNEVLDPVDVPHEEVASRDAPVVVVMCRSERISAIFEGMTREMRMLPVRWLLVPTDFVLNVPADNLPAKVFSILPLVDKKDRLLQFLSDEEMQKDHMNHREATRSPLFVKTAAGIVELLKPFRSVQESHCRGKSSCPELEKLIEDISSGAGALEPIRSLQVTPERIMDTLNLLKIDATDNEAFLYITSQAREGRTEDAAIFQVFDVKSREIKPVPLIVNERLFNERRSRTKRTKRVFRVSVDDIERMRRKEEEEAAGGADDFPPYDKHPCVDILTREESNLTRSCGICQNFLRFFARSTRSTTDGSAGEEGAPEATWSWRFRTWVTVNASVASIGAICTAAVSIFIVLRICKGDILEGSPHFSFLILLSIILLYASTLPFSLDAPRHSPLVCRLRVISPTVAYPALFSIILSRSVMVIISERDGGIMNHVNGCLQSVLCFFMCAVQVALTSQFCIYNPFGDADCETIHAGHRFVLLLFYSFFLLALLALAAPFTMRSKRNYREGTFFSIATVLVVIVWLAWVTVYYLLPVEEREAAVALGLTATATAVLLSVFIPRTYLMATATVRDKITNALPSLAYLNASNISEINYRSNQALYDSVTVKYGTPKLSFTNPRIYSVHVSNSAPASPNNFPVNPDSSDYVLNRRKTFIEVSRGESPQNSYDSQESPDMTGKITRF